MAERVVCSFLFLALFVIFLRPVLAKFRIKKFMIVLGLSHFILMAILFVIFIAGSHIDQHQFFLLIPCTIDFPISIVCILLSFKNANILMILLMLFGSTQYSLIGWLIDLLIMKRERTKLKKGGSKI